MTRIENVKHGLACHLHRNNNGLIKCDECPYNRDDDSRELFSYEKCTSLLYDDCILLIDDMENTIKLLEAEQ